MTPTTSAATGKPWCRCHSVDTPYLGSTIRSLDETSSTSLVRFGKQWSPPSRGCGPTGRLRSQPVHLSSDRTWHPHKGDARRAATVAEKVFGTIPLGCTEFTLVPEKLLSQGGGVVVVGHVKATATTTGTSRDAPLVHVSTVRDGKVARLTNHHGTPLAGNAGRVGGFPPSLTSDKGACGRTHHRLSPRWVGAESHQ